MRGREISECACEQPTDDMLKRSLGSFPVFAASHLAREIALVYQRYTFFATLGATTFGIASMAVAPALFFAGFLTMITGELAIAFWATPEEQRGGADAVKYILVLEAVGIVVGVLAIVVGAALLPISLIQNRWLLLASAAVILTSGFSQIAINWALLRGGRSIYAAAFYVESAAILITSGWMVRAFGPLAVVLAYCIRPLTLSACAIIGLGPRRILSGTRLVLSCGDARRGRTIHGQAGHQVGSLLIKSSWSSLDVLMVGSFAGPTGAGHYRLLKTLASVPSMAVSPVWMWLRPDIAQAVSNRRYRLLIRRVTKTSAMLSIPAVIMLFVPISWFDAVYRWVFPKDDLPASFLKNSMVLWWLVASGSAWARSLTVATGQLSASTLGNLIVFAGAFLIGPLLVWLADFNPIYIVPGTLAALNVYWFWYLYGLRRLEAPVAAST